MIPDTLLCCQVCQQRLQNPITLSCGYTICKSCLPLDSQQTSFICPVRECTKQTHLFGPAISVDQVVEQCLEKNYTLYDKDTIKSITELLTCPMGHHCLEYPITTHCGHTFCKLCLLQYKIANDACNVCHKRLPSYQFIQHQTPNQLVLTLLSGYHQLNLDDDMISSSNQISNNTIDFSSTDRVYENIPIHLTDFPILPTQKLWMPIYTENQRQFFLQSLLLCKQYQCLCFAILKKDKANHKHRFGTIVKVNNIKQQKNDVMIQITSLDRFVVQSVLYETDDAIRADVMTKFECAEECDMFMKDPHVDPISLPPSPILSIKSLVTNARPLTPPADHMDISETTIRLSYIIHDFIDTISQTVPTNAFCSTVDGLFGPVWLDTVQKKHGDRPSVDHPVALCWWSAIILPVGSAERYQILQTESLQARLKLVVSWINELQSTWVRCRQTAINSALKAGC